MMGRPLQVHYRILQRLGAGGMGEVFAAQDTRLNRKVALKVLAPSIAADPERRDRFPSEAQTVASLNHPNIVTIYSVEEDAGVQFLTMDLIEGKTLDEVIPKGGMTPDQIAPQRLHGRDQPERNRLQTPFTNNDRGAAMLQL